MELIYIWTKRNIIPGIVKEFKFSTKFQIKYEEVDKELFVDSINSNYVDIYKQNSIINVNSIVGDNGVGKTSLLKFIQNMRKIHLNNFNTKYNDKDKNEYVAVYLDLNNEIIIVNYTKDVIKIGKESIPRYSSKKYSNGRLKECIMEKCSHIYLTESEYYKDDNLKNGNNIDVFDLTNRSIRIFCKDFYSSKGTIDISSMSIEGTRFNILQSIFPDVINSTRFQSLIDIDFYSFISREKITFSGKKVDKIIFKIDDIASMLNNSNINNSSYFIKSIHGKDVETFIENIENEKNNLKKFESDMIYPLIINLLGELLFSHDFRIKDVSSTDKILLCVLNYVDSISDEKEKEYFKSAVCEIQSFKKLLFRKKSNYNEIEKSYKVPLNYLSSFLSKMIRKKSSFILKYISINNLFMSSGERALLNMMSRLYFFSKLKDYYKDKDYVLHTNVLLLIDEIDLYLHPEWQRKIIINLVEELNNCFSSHRFQIIISTHSPIVLSDIPVQNSIFLKKIDGVIESINNRTETFSSSIHSLYKDAFFLENGAIGEFAKTYINNIAKELRNLKEINEQNKEEIEKKINLIGEPILKRQLDRILNKKNKQVISLPSSQNTELICFLEKQKNELEIQIMKLKEDRND